MNKNARILIVGAGAAGIATAWYLRQAGFKRVKLLERNGRIGGKCLTVTWNGDSFDLGANYITAAYREVLKLARRVGADTYKEPPGRIFNKDTGRYQSIFDAARGEHSLLAMAGYSLRYLLKRRRLNPVLGPAAPGFRAASRHPELLQSMDDWLQANGLTALRPLFEVPITLMGYGELNSIPAAYALTYMNIPTFINLAMFGVDFPDIVNRWPRRFTQGYERFLQRLAAEVDVQRNVRIDAIRRHADGVTCTYRTQETSFDSVDHSGPREEEFDYLVLAVCHKYWPGQDAAPAAAAVGEDPQAPALNGLGLDLSDEEKRLFAKVQFVPFSVSTFEAPQLEHTTAVTFITGNDARRPGKPYGMTRQFADSDLVSVYTRLEDKGPDSVREERDRILANNRELLGQLGSPDADQLDYLHYHMWPYFPHVKPEDMAGRDGEAPFYEALEGLQGVNRTYYVGGLLAFELVETIFCHAKALVAEHFGDR